MWVKTKFSLACLNALADSIIFRLLLKRSSGSTAVIFVTLKETSGLRLILEKGSLRTSEQLGAKHLKQGAEHKKKKIKNQQHKTPYLASLGAHFLI